jgi:hypothetical protein
LFEGEPICLTRKELIAVDEIQQRHGLAT